MEIKVLNIKEVNNAGNLKAFVDLALDSVEIRSFKIVKEEGKDAWISLPQTQYKDKDGKTKYFNLINVSNDQKEQIKNTVLKAWGRK